MRFLQKINIYHYILFLILFICLVPRVFAYENTDTTYTYNIPDYKTPMEEVTCSNTTLFDYVNYIIDNVDFSTSSYQLYIPTPTTTSSSKLMLYLVPSDITDINIRGYHTRYNNEGQIYFPYYSTGGYVYLYFSNCSSVTDMYSLPFTTQLINRLQSGTTIDSSIAYMDGVYNYSEAQQRVTTSFQMNPSAISNTSNNSASIWFYYSSQHLVLNYNDNNNDYYYKKLYLNNEDITINKLDYVPSYYDLYVSTPSTNSFVDYKTRLDTFYTNLLPQNVSSYNLKVQFNTPSSILGYSQDPQEYIDNLNFDYLCSGRVNYTDYYQYESFPCSLSLNSSYSNNTVTLNFSNLSYSTSLTNYEKIYVTINTNYNDDSLNKIIYQTSTTFTGGNVYNTQYKGTIYENLDNLPLNFKLYISSNNSLVDSNVYMFKYAVDYKIKIVGFSNTTNQQNLVVGHSILGTNNINLDTNTDPYFSNFQVSNSIDTGIMIYQDNSIIAIPRLELFFNSGITLTINQSNNSTFYYVDSDGNIVSHSLTISYNNQNNSKYDITYYVDIVNSFLNDLTDDSLELATLTQNFYDSMPLIFQSFIFVVFILFCVYFTYLLIKKE